MPWRWAWVLAMSAASEWRDDLDRWLQPFLSGLLHPARRAMCPLYVAGLIGLGDRKSVQSMAARADGVQVSVAAETILADMTGRAVTWRHGTKGRLRARFCALRVRTADGPTQRIGAKGNQHLHGPFGDGLRSFRCTDAEGGRAGLAR